MAAAATATADDTFKDEDVAFEEDWSDVAIENAYEDLSDKDLRVLAIEEGKALLAKAEAVKWSTVRIRSLDGNSFMIRLPTEWQLCRVKEVLAGMFGISAYEMRLVFQGAIGNNTETIGAYTSNSKEPITIHIITNITGS